MTPINKSVLSPISLTALHDQINLNLSLRQVNTSNFAETRVPVYSQQRVFIEDRHHFAAFIGGIGSGKTWSGAIKALEFALSKPCTGMVTSPTYNVLRDATVPTFREVAGEHIVSITRSYPINCTLSNGSTILFRSAHQPELLRGPSLAWWWGDEAALYHKSVWGIMIGRLRQGGRLGYAWLSTTPKGRNWIFQEFIQKDRDKYAVYKASTRDNTFIDPDYYNMLAESYSGDFARQELDGDFVAFEGLIYPFFDRDLHITTRPFPNEFAMVAAGVDWGFANNGVIAVFGVDYDGRMWGLHEEVARHRRVEEWAEIAKELEQQHKIEYFFCDPAVPDNIDTFNSLGVHAVPAENEVWLGIQSVQNRLVKQGDGLPRLILPPSFVHSAAEFESYQWAEHKDGLHDKPKKVGDHSMDAIRYCSVGVDLHFGMDKVGVLHHAAETTFSPSNW
jgi:PBSX family phage terminase large subunit